MLVGDEIGTNGSSSHFLELGLLQAYHEIGPDWTFDGQVYVPAKCNHYHIRFRAAMSTANVWIDDARVIKVVQNTTADVYRNTVLPPRELQQGFIKNTNFKLDHSYWKYAPASGYVDVDSELGRNVMVLRNNKLLRQNVLPHAVPGEDYQFRFWAKVEGADVAPVRLIMRFRLTTRDKTKSPCRRKICNFYRRIVAKDVLKKDGWTEVVTDKFDMFRREPEILWGEGANYTQFEVNSRIDYILLQLRATPSSLGAGGKLKIADFEMLNEDYTVPPSISMVPSSTPTNLIQTSVGYVVRYAGEIRTVIQYPFQVDKTGEILPMDGSRSYKLCGQIDEVEGMLSEFPNRMHFWYQQKCVAIRHGNPSVRF